MEGLGFGFCNRVRVVCAHTLSRAGIALIESSRPDHPNYSQSGFRVPTPKPPLQAGLTYLPLSVFAEIRVYGIRGAARLNISKDEGKP